MVVSKRVQISENYYNFRCFLLVLSTIFSINVAGFFGVYEYYYFVILIVYDHDNNIVNLLLHTIISHIIDLRVTF